METREEKTSALDAFAKLTNVSPPVAVPGHSLATQETHVGAIAVAVKRDEVAILQRIKAIAAAAGTDFFYRFPVKNRRENRNDWIEGPSIKLANEVARIFGNCEVDIRVQDLGDNWLFYARFIDLETGYSMTRPFQQRKSAGKIGGDDDARRLDIAFQIGASKAIRNVVVNALQTFADFAFDEARNSLVERIGKDLARYKQNTVERVSAKVDLKRVEAVIGRIADDWLAPDVAKVIAMMRAVADGMATMDETFPPIGGASEPDTQSGAASVLDSFASDSGPTDTPTSTARSSSDASPPKPKRGASEDSQVNNAELPMLDRLKAGIATATDEAGVNQVWENLGLDDFYNDNPGERRAAWKLCTDRIAELNGGK